MPQGAAPKGGGGILPSLLFFKRKIVRLGSKMDHISANLAFGRREKNIWGYKKAPEKPKKKWRPFFCFVFGKSKKLVGVAKNSARGTKC